MKRTTWIILGVIAIILIWAISVRNTLASSETNINGLWGTVQTQYNRKAKVYDNMVKTIKGAARNEDTTLIKIVQMRSRVPNITSSSTPAQIAQADKQLDAIGQSALSINVEAYPTLKATELFSNLQTVIEGTENRVTVALKDWNDSVTDYNLKLVRFPTNVIGSIMGFHQKKNYEAPEGSENTDTDFGS